eukprot:15814360-Heterocapsa_arctica.AAC.1
MALDSDWIWVALANGKESLLADAYVDHFDWNATHDRYGTPLIAAILAIDDGGDVSCGNDSSKQAQERLSLLKLVLEKGGNPNMKPPSGFRAAVEWFRIDSSGKPVEETRTKLQFAG